MHVIFFRVLLIPSCTVTLASCILPRFPQRPRPAPPPNTRCRCFTHRRPTANSRVSWNFFPSSTFSNLTPKNRTRQQKDGPLTRLLERKERAVARRAQASRIEWQRTRPCAKNNSVAEVSERSWLPARLRPPPMIPERLVSLFSGGWVTFHGAL